MTTLDRAAYINAPRSADEMPSLEEAWKVLQCDACIECLYTGGAWHAHTCGMPNVEITQEGT